VRTAFAYALLLLTPLAAFSILWHVLDSLAKTRRRRADAAASAPPLGMLHGARPVEQLRDDLHRLAAEIERIERSNQPAKAARLRATTLAYDDVLIAACRAMQVPSAERSPLDPLSRLEAEAELSLAGLSW
jgi:hypothetical protein